MRPVPTCMPVPVPTCMPVQTCQVHAACSYLHACTNLFSPHLQLHNLFPSHLPCPITHSNKQHGWLVALERISAPPPSSNTHASAEPQKGCTLKRREATQQTPRATCLEESTHPNHQCLGEVERITDFQGGINDMEAEMKMVQESRRLVQSQAARQLLAAARVGACVCVCVPACVCVRVGRCRASR